MFRKFIFIALMFVSINNAIGQPGAGGGAGTGGPGGPIDPGTGNEPPPEGAVPVDAGLGILLATGVAYGAKKAKDYRKNKVKSEK